MVWCWVVVGGVYRSSQVGVHFGLVAIIVGSFWDQSGITLESLCDHVWGHFGVTLESLWDHCGVILAWLQSPSCHIGFTLGSLWGHWLFPWPFWPKPFLACDRQSLRHAPRMHSSSWQGATDPWRDLGHCLGCLCGSSCDGRQDHLALRTILGAGLPAWHLLRGLQRAGRVDDGPFPGAAFHAIQAGSASGGAHADPHSSPRMWGQTCATQPDGCAIVSEDHGAGISCSTGHASAAGAIATERHDIVCVEQVQGSGCHGRELKCNQPHLRCRESSHTFSQGRCEGRVHCCKKAKARSTSECMLQLRAERGVRRFRPRRGCRRVVQAGFP